MAGFLRQSTASQSRALGPFIDDTDFKTPKTGLTIANTDVKLVINGAASANKNSGGGTHRVNGVYGFTFDATDTATVGEMEVSIAVATALVVFDKFYVLEAAIFDAFYAAGATGLLPANVTQIDGQATNGTNATLNLKQINIVNSAGSAIIAVGNAAGAHGIIASGNGSGHGFKAQGGATGHGIAAIGGATSGDGINSAATTAGNGIAATGIGAGDGLKAVSGATGHGIEAVGGGTSGDGFNVSAAGSGLDINAVNSDVGAVKPTVVGRTLDVSATGEAGIDWANIGAPTTTNNLSGTTVKAVTDAVSANTTQLAGQTVTAAAGVTFPASVASPTNITAGTITTVTNLTNAATAGDLTATMKASVETAVAATVVDGTTTLAESLRLANSANGGITSGGATTTFTIRDLADTKDRVVATVDANGDRSVVTRNLT